MSAPNSVDFFRRRALVCAGMSTPLISACALAGCQRRAVESAVESFAVALPKVPHAGLVFLASEQGFFNSRRLAVTLHPQIHGKAALAELLAGRVDLAVAADVPVVIEALKGSPLSIVATVANASNEMAVVARRDRGIARAADIAKRRIGVTFGTSGEYFLWAFLVHHRMAPQSVQFVDLPPSRLMEALRVGEVDGIAAWQPVRHQVELTFGEAVTTLKAPNAYAQGFVLVGLKAQIVARQKALQRLLGGMLEAESFARHKPSDAKAVLARLFDLDPRTLGPFWNELTLEVEQQQAQLVTLEDVALWAMARGYVPVQPMPNFLASLSLEALLAINPERVTVAR